MTADVWRIALRSLAFIKGLWRLLYLVFQLFSKLKHV